MQGNRCGKIKRFYPGLGLAGLNQQTLLQIVHCRHKHPGLCLYLLHDRVHANQIMADGRINGFPCGELGECSAELLHQLAIFLRGARTEHEGGQQDPEQRPEAQVEHRRQAAPVNERQGNFFEHGTVAIMELIRANPTRSVRGNGG